ncbi:hypothetical protein C8J56DRAFT_553808 [Mycena floridula]|nr:hypothetical protein C8J56DRAFT_553808 [Mycena floridula]
MVNDMRVDATDLGHTGTSHSTESSTHSTPATEFSTSSSFVLPPETEEMRLRRAQSDLASSEIGNRLLKGWAMLGEECPNPLCYGVPLCRPPKAGGEKDPRKECVVCGEIYLTETDWAGREKLVVMRPPEALVPDKKEKQNAVDLPQPEVPIIVRNAPSVVVPEPRPALPAPQSTPGQKPTDTLLEEARTALEKTITTLSQRLTSVSSHPAFDPVLLGQIAEALGKATYALSQVRALQSAELGR